MFLKTKGAAAAVTVKYTVLIILYLCFCWYIEAGQIEVYQSIQNKGILKQQAFIDMAIVYKNCSDPVFIKKEAERIRIKNNFDQKTMQEICNKIEELIRQYRSDN